MECHIWWISRLEQRHPVAVSARDYIKRDVSNWLLPRANEMHPRKFQQ
jgi:hypothetical protein